MLTFQIKGMTCGHCVMAARKGLEAVPGVSEVAVTLDPPRAVVTYDPAKTGVGMLEAAVRDRAARLERVKGDIMSCRVVLETAGRHKKHGRQFSVHLDLKVKGSEIAVTREHDEPLVPHGMAVSLTAPEAFRWTFGSSPERHLRAASLLAPGHEYDGADALPAVLVDLMRDIGIPNGLAAVGYRRDDVADLVEGAMKQQRLLATAPREVTEQDAAAILESSLELW